MQLWPHVISWHNPFSKISFGLNKKGGIREGGQAVSWLILGHCPLCSLSGTTSRSGSSKSPLHLESLAGDSNFAIDYKNYVLHKTYGVYFSFYSSILLLIIYTTFCDTFKSMLPVHVVSKMLTSDITYVSHITFITEL